MGPHGKSPRHAREAERHVRERLYHGVRWSRESSHAPGKPGKSMTERIGKFIHEAKHGIAKTGKRRWSVNRWRVRRAMRAAAAEMCAAHPGEAFPPVVTKISPNDRMFKANAAHYFRVGYSALRNIRAALDAADRVFVKRDVRAILDLPCGHGRVLRMLKAEFPQARISACDLEADGVDFCAKTFGAVPIHSKHDPADIGLRDRFDLVWVGSLFTHLDAARWLGFLRFFQSVLAPAGVLIFTTHGAYAAECMRERTRTYGLTPAQLDAVVGGYERDGFGYSDYRPGAHYGISLSSDDWVKSMLSVTPGLTLLEYGGRAWDQHQDVVACVTRPSLPRD
jgi:SAM-dependent methyltransferase